MSGTKGGIAVFEEEVDGTPRPCSHEIRWYHRLAAWAHARIEELPFPQWQALHDRQPKWVCEAYERVTFDFPCWACEADRYREYGATIKTDADVIAKFPPPYVHGDGSSCAGCQTCWATELEDVLLDPLAFDEADEPVDCSNGCPDHDFRRRGCPGGCGGKDCCGGHECDGDCS